MTHTTRDAARRQLVRRDTKGRGVQARSKSPQPLLGRTAVNTRSSRRKAHLPLRLLLRAEHRALFGAEQVEEHGRVVTDALETGERDGALGGDALRVLLLDRLAEAGLQLICQAATRAFELREDHGPLGARRHQVVRHHRVYPVAHERSRARRPPDGDDARLRHEIAVVLLVREGDVGALARLGARRGCHGGARHLRIPHDGVADARGGVARFGRRYRHLIAAVQTAREASGAALVERGLEAAGAGARHAYEHRLVALVLMAHALLAEARLRAHPLERTRVPARKADVWRRAL
eukprot:6203320-Pleurochrysis_carterae.AAC.1